MARRSLVLFGALLLVVGVTATGMGASDYSISAQPTIDVPERTVTHNGNDYTISGIARVEPNGTLSVTTDVPGDTLNTAYLYNDGQKIEEAERDTGDQSFSIDTGTLTAGAGSYMLVLETDTIEAVYPVVVSEYDVAVSVPSSVTQGDSVETSGSISPTIDSPSDPTVTVVVGNDSVTVSETASLEAASGTRSFSATISADQLAAGTYSAYVVVRGPETVNGEKELIGVSNAYEITVETESDTGGQSPTQSTTTTTRTSTTTTITSASTTETSTTVTTSTTTPQDSQSTTETPPTSTVDSTTTAPTPSTSRTTSETTTADVITPESPTTTSTTATQVPLFRPSLLALLVGSLALLGLRRGE